METRDQERLAVQPMHRLWLTTNIAHSGSSPCSARDRSWPDPVVSIGALLEELEVVRLTDQRSCVARESYDRQSGEHRLDRAALESELTEVGPGEEPVTSSRLAHAFELGAKGGEPTRSRNPGTTRDTTR